MTIRDIINKTMQKLEAAGIPSARLDTEILLAFCLSCDRLEFIKNPDKTIHEAQLSAFNQLVIRRLRWEPVAYITGRKDFWSFTLEINSSVLIPRPDTEVVVEEALAVCRTQSFNRPRILDIGTGSGAIALALAKEIPEAQITATDISLPSAATGPKKCVRFGTGKFDYLSSG
ncbi:MAG: peptide chain release factor N(5)-glutamine methyltransferase [Desulfobacterales bacterium]|nr:peptide chain release factor N(5)-glutamine methyltransferase [Desulfobacterales bacterium]